MISAIVAVDNNWGIGNKGELLAHIPNDLKYFKQLTSGHVVVMGRKTWDSLPHKPLKDRLNIVITRQDRHFDDMTAFIPLEEAISRMTHLDPNDEWFIIGGGTIYEALLPYCDRVYVTKIYDLFDADTWFPVELDNSDDWRPTSKSQIYTYNDLNYQFWQFDRIS